MVPASIDLGQTIYALCTGNLPSAVAIVRVSGILSRKIFLEHFQLSNGRAPLFERGMHFGALVDRGGNPIDTVVVLAFPGPNSLTGEDVIEIQCHGSIAVFRAIEELLVSWGVRKAERGEFSFRSLTNGKVSPQEIEQLSDLFRAGDSRDLSAIYGRRTPAVEREFAKVRNDLLRLQSILDTAIDFSDEYSSVIAAALPATRAIIQSIQPVIQRYSLFRSGSATPRFVIAGRPNAGKSSLLNCLVGRYRSIVHERPGTTRDVVEEDVEIGGRRWKVVDTAGVREVGRSAEALGIEMGRNYLRGASAWVLVVDGTVGLKEDDDRLLTEFAEIPHLVLWNKSDLPDWRSPSVCGAMAGSTLQASGTSDFVVRVGELLISLDPRNEAVVLPSASEYARFQFVFQELVGVEKMLVDSVAPEYVAEKVRSLCSSLSLVVGEISREEVLDRIFHEFCVGK